MPNGFFKNGDKVYSENLNDGVLLGNAFDWTVTVSLPGDTGSVFPSSSDVLKAKVCDVSITPNSNLSIGSTVSNSSGSSQTYRLTVYPNFNRFGGFKSITLTADSGVTFYIANKGGTSPIVNNLDYTNLGNVPELKVLKEYDIVLTIPTGKSVSGLSFVLQSSSADVSASISQSNVEELGTRLTSIESKNTTQDGRLTSLETYNTNQRSYEVYASNYNPQIDTDITIYCKVTGEDGAVSGETVSFLHNGETLGTATTNAQGVASYTATCSAWGVQDYSVGNSHTQVLVDGYKKIYENGAATITLLRNKTRAKLLFGGHTYNVPASWASMGATLSAAVANVRPRRDVCLFNHDALVEFQIQNDGDVYCQATNGTAINNKSLIGQVEWSIKDEDL